MPQLPFIRVTKLPTDLLNLLKESIAVNSVRLEVRRALGKIFNSLHARHELGDIGFESARLELTTPESNEVT